MHVTSSRILRCPNCSKIIESRQFISTLEFGVPLKRCGHCGFMAYDGVILEAALLSDQSLLKDAAKKARDWLIIMDFFIGILLMSGIAALTNNIAAAFAAAACAVALWSLVFMSLMKKRGLKSCQKEIEASLNRLSADENYARSVISMQGVQAGSAYERTHRGSAELPGPRLAVPRDLYARRTDREDKRHASRLLRTVTGGRSTAVKVYLFCYALGVIGLPAVMGSVLRVPAPVFFNPIFSLLFLAFSAASVWFIILLSAYVRRYRPLKRCILYLIEAGVGNDVNNLTSRTADNRTVDGAVFSDTLFYCRRAGLVARYGDILWLYETGTENRVYGIPVQRGSYMVLCTVLGKAHITATSRAIQDELKKRNENMMVGYTMLHRQTYDALVPMPSIARVGRFRR